jgi:hypothetical protein
MKKTLEAVAFWAVILIAFVVGFALHSFRWTL